MTNNEKEREEVNSQIQATQKLLEKLKRKARKLALDLKFTEKVDPVRPDLDAMKELNEEGLGPLAD